MGQKIGIGMLGAGNVGGGVVSALPTLNNRYLNLTGNELELLKVLVRDINKKRIGLNDSQLTSEIDDVISDKSIQIVIEVLGNEQPACEYIKRCLVPMMPKKVLPHSLKEENQILKVNNGSYQQK